MKTHFSFTRFWWLLKKHTSENIKHYLMSAAVLMGVMTLFMGFLIITETSPMNSSKQTLVFVVLLLVTGPIFTSTIFSHLGDKRKAIATLTLPASHFEKYLIGWLFSYVIFQVVYIGCFYLVASILIPLDDWHGEQQELMPLFSKDDGQVLALKIFFFFHSLALMGSILFEKWHYIKTALILFSLGLLIVILNKPLMQAIFGRDLEEAFPFSSVTIQEAGVEYYIRFPQDNEFMMSLALIGTAVLLRASAYFRLKEKQV